MAEGQGNKVKGNSEIVERLMDAQADLQTALGFHRLDAGRGGLVERRMTDSLARLHALLADLGAPMYEPVERSESDASSVPDSPSSTSVRGV